MVLAAAMPAIVLLALEGGLRLAGYGKPATFLIPDGRPGWFRTNPEFASLFLPGNFDLRPLNFSVSLHKAPKTVRIVVLGESAAQGDMDGLVRNLQAAELSGPVTATFELTLALKLYQLRRLDEMMIHLALARRLSAHEGNAAVTDSIEGLVGRMRIEWEEASAQRARSKE